MNATSGATSDSTLDFGRQAPPDTIFAGTGIGEPFRDPIGRRAWTKEDAALAARTLGANGYAILRVEVWCLCWDETYCSVVPYVDDQYGCFDWRLEDMWSPNLQSWEEFCSRSVAWAVDKIALADYEPHLTADYPAEKMRIHLTAVSREDYD